MKTLIGTLLAFLVLETTIGCSGNKNVVKDVDDKMEVYGQNDGAQIGLDTKKQIIIQKETSAEAELKVQQLNNYDTERRLFDRRAELLQCRQEIADPRLQGNGEVREIPEVDNMKGLPEVREEIGMTSQGLNVVKREMFLERLDVERRYEKTMLEMISTLKRFSGACQNELRAARVKAGLPATRYSGTGHFDGQGNWVVERHAELTLDDAFHIRAEAK